MRDLTFAEWQTLRKDFPLWAAFDEAEDEFGQHKSTEFLVQIVCDREGVEYEDVMSDIANCAAEKARIEETG